MYVCKKCNVEKQQDEYQLDKRRGKYYATCRQCRVQASREHRLKNLEKYRERTRLYVQKWRKENPDKANAICRRWAEKNREYVRSYHRVKSAEWRAKNPEKEWRLTNPEAAKESGKKARIKWLEKNPNYHHEHYVKNKSMYVANRANRRDLQAQATPKWLTNIQKAQIAEFYEIAKTKEMQTGQKYHVDHIIPINGQNVCGLHVPWNLQIITATENLSKGNRMLTSIHASQTKFA